MKEKDFVKYVDEYYAHKENAEDINITDENALLFSSLDTMSSIEDFAPIIELDIMDIINKGEEISLARKDRKDFLLFLLSAFLLIGSAFAFIYINKQILIYTYLAIAALLPFSLVPISYYRIAKGGLQ